MHSKKEEQTLTIPFDDLEVSKVSKTFDNSSSGKSPLRQIHNRFSIAKLEEFVIAGDREAKEDSPNSPSRKKLIIRSPSTIKAETNSPYLATPQRDHKALVEHYKEKIDKKIRINRDWRRDSRENTITKEPKSFTIDLECASPLKPAPLHKRSKTLNNTESNIEENQPIEFKAGSKSPVRISSFRQETESKFILQRPKPVPSARLKTEFSVDK